MVRVGAELIVFDTEGGESLSSPFLRRPAARVGERSSHCSGTDSASPVARAAEGSRSTRIMASPASRRRAREAGSTWRRYTVAPGGRILRQDLDSALSDAIRGASAPRRSDRQRAWRCARHRRDQGHRGAAVIANRMTDASATFRTRYVEEVDVTELESLRQHLNARLRPAPRH